MPARARSTACAPVRRSLAAVVAAGMLALAAATTPAPVTAQAPIARPGDVEMAACTRRASRALTDAAKATLLRIPDGDRRLLALRGYLRSPDLAGNWSWTAAETADWQRSGSYARAMRELAKVQQRFSELNPGYRLHINTDVRTVETQVLRWNENASVARAAAGLAPRARHVCVQKGPGAFAEWLRGSTLSAPANLAVPGLSPHGQGRAFDFQVFQGERLVAGTDSTRIAADWRAGGWATRLADAVKVSRAFRGPLESPNEPWHYAYIAD